MEILEWNLLEEANLEFLKIKKKIECLFQILSWKYFLKK